MSSLAPTDHRLLLTLGPAAPDVRRTVGPIAWAALECLAASCVDRDGETVSYESVRGIADSLDLAKDTVARALRRLIAKQFVTYVPSRADDGRFGSATIDSRCRSTSLPNRFMNRHRHHQSRTVSQDVSPQDRVPHNCPLIDALAIDP